MIYGIFNKRWYNVRIALINPYAIKYAIFPKFNNKPPRNKVRQFFWGNHLFYFFGGNIFLGGSQFFFDQFFGVTIFLGVAIFFKSIFGGNQFFGVTNFWGKTSHISIDQSLIEDPIKKWKKSISQRG